jgi:hypothetical protein
MIHIGGSLLELGVGADHFDRDQILADAEMLQRPLRLGSPKPISWDVDLAEAVGFLSHGGLPAFVSDLIRLHVRHGAHLG